MSREQEQGTPEWYVAELHALAGAITGRGVGVCNGAALTIERLSHPKAASSTQASEVKTFAHTADGMRESPAYGEWVRLTDYNRLIASSTTPASGASERAPCPKCNTLIAPNAHDADGACPATRAPVVESLPAQWREEAKGVANTNYEQGRVEEKLRCAYQLEAALTAAQEKL